MTSELATLTWPEAKEAIARAECAIVPTGSFEQHAPYMTFTVDTERAVAFSRLLAARLAPRVVVAPPVAFGISYHHMPFAGTVTLRPETFRSIVHDVVWSLREHGIRQFLIVNGHGGNASALDELVVTLPQDLGVKVAWAGPTALASLFTKGRLADDSGHCGQNETSQAMYLAPHVVRPERIVKGSTSPLPTFTCAAPARSITRTAGTRSPTTARSATRRSRPPSSGSRSRRRASRAQPNSCSTSWTGTGSRLQFARVGVLLLRPRRSCERYRVRFRVLLRAWRTAARCSA